MPFVISTGLTRHILIQPINISTEETKVLGVKYIRCVIHSFEWTGTHTQIFC